MPEDQNRENKGWDLGKDPQKYMEEYNQKARLSNYPPDKQVEVQGLMFEGGLAPGSNMVAIQGRDHKHELWTVCMDLPNAMYLLNLLHQILKATNAPVPTEAPNGSMRKGR